MSKPAATLGDMHVCPKKNGKIPHVGGPVIAGSPSVLIGGRPAAKVGDALICVGPPDTIKSGSRSVTINGKAAARRGDSTAHGGTIVVGNPTVLIGDKAWRGPNEGTLPPFPESKSEVMQRMDAATDRVVTARANNQPLPASPYTTEDKLFMVAGGLDEKFLVRVIETKYAGDQGTIGRIPEGKTTTTYWTTTYTQVEHAGTDPELLTSSLGITYDSSANYTMLLIDQEVASEQGDMQSFIPTYDNLAEFAEKELKDSFAGEEHLIREALTPECSEAYEKFFTVANENNINLSSSLKFQELADDMGLAPEESKRIQARHKLNMSLGANEQFLGNGLTKDNKVPYSKTPFGPADPATAFGPVETFTRDKNPQSLLKLEQAGVITRIPLG